MNISKGNVEEIAAWCAEVTGGLVALTPALTKGLDGYWLHVDAVLPQVRQHGQRSNRLAAVYYATAGAVVAQDQVVPVPELVTRVIAELSGPHLIRARRDGQQRGRAAALAARCAAHGGLGVNGPRPSCPGCRAAAQRHPDGCPLCIYPRHPLTEQCPYLPA